MAMIAGMAYCINSFPILSVPNAVGVFCPAILYLLFFRGRKGTQFPGSRQAIGRPLLKKPFEAGQATLPAGRERCQTLIPKYISRLKLYISKLKTWIFNLKTWISSLEIKFKAGQRHPCKQAESTSSPISCSLTTNTGHCRVLYLIKRFAIWKMFRTFVPKLSEI